MEEAGVQVVAISYDSVKVLATFAKSSNIEFPLLSDPDSKVITAYGLLNDAIKVGRLKGIPHPATLVIDRTGMIQAKLAREGYRERHPNEELLKVARSLNRPK